MLLTIGSVSDPDRIRIHQVSGSVSGFGIRIWIQEGKIDQKNFGHQTLDPNPYRMNTDPKYMTI
jgi:hypothetical protein